MCRAPGQCPPNAFTLWGTSTMAGAAPPGRQLPDTHCLWHGHPRREGLGMGLCSSRTARPQLTRLTCTSARYARGTQIYEFCQAVMHMCKAYGLVSQHQHGLGSRLTPPFSRVKGTQDACHPKVDPGTLPPAVDRDFTGDGSHLCSGQGRSGDAKGSPCWTRWTQGWHQVHGHRGWGDEPSREAEAPRAGSRIQTTSPYEMLALQGAARPAMCKQQPDEVALIIP